MICMVSSWASIIFWNAPEEEGVRIDHIVVLKDNGNNEEEDLVDEADDGRDDEDVGLVPHDTGKPD